MLLTEFQKGVRSRHKKILHYYEKLRADPKNNSTTIEKKVMKKFNIKARSTVWVIVNKKQKAVL